MPPAALENDTPLTEEERPTKTADDGGDEGEGAAAADDAKTPVDRPGGPSRAEKRAARAAGYAQLTEKLAERDAEIERMRQENARRDRDFAEMRGQLTERAKHEKKTDPYADEIARLDAAAKADLKAAAAMAKDNPAEAERLVDEHRKKERQIARLEWQQEQEAKQEQARANQPAQLPQEVQHDVFRMMSENPWIKESPANNALVGGMIQRMVDGGAPANYTTFNAAAKQIAKTLGLGGQNGTPTDGQRARYNGRGAGEADGGSDDAAPSSVDPLTDKHQRALAQALANRRGTGESGAEAKATWDKIVGKRLKDKRAE